MDDITAKKNTIRKLLPSPEDFKENGDRSDVAVRKAVALRAILKAGSLSKAIEIGAIDRATAWRYCQDEVFSGRLKQVEAELAAMLAEKAIAKAFDGDNDMIKFTLPAVDPRFDPGVRKAKAQAAGRMRTDLFKSLLESGQGQAPITAPFAEVTNHAESLEACVVTPDNVTYQTNETEQPLPSTEPDKPEGGEG